MAMNSMPCRSDRHAIVTGDDPIDTPLKSQTKIRVTFPPHTPRARGRAREARPRSSGSVTAGAHDRVWWGEEGRAA
jgi:hypothetical protein